MCIKSQAQSKKETQLFRDKSGGNEERDPGAKIVFILATLKEF